MLAYEQCAGLDEKSYDACSNSSRPSLFAKMPLLGESTKGKQNAVDCKSGRNLHHTSLNVPNIATFFQRPIRNSNVFFCP